MPGLPAAFAAGSRSITPLFKGAYRSRADCGVSSDLVEPTKLSLRRNDTDLICRRCQIRYWLELVNSAPVEETGHVHSVFLGVDHYVGGEV